MANISNLKANGYMLKWGAPFLPFVRQNRRRDPCMGNTGSQEICVHLVLVWVASKHKILFTIVVRVSRYIAGLRPINNVQNKIRGFALCVGFSPVISKAWC